MCNDCKCMLNLSYARQIGNISEVFEGTPQDIATLIELLGKPKTTECRLKLNIDDDITNEKIVLTFDVESCLLDNLKQSKAM